MLQNKARAVGETAKELRRLNSVLNQTIENERSTDT